MKRIAILAICLYLMSNTLAENITTKQQAVEGICGDAADYAKQIMSGRHVGVTIRDALKVANNANLPEPKNTFFKSIIYDAYKHPMIYDGKLQVIAESEFSNKVFMTCSDSMLKEFADIP